MPDYNRAATVYWWATVLSGALLLLWCLAWLVQQPALVALQVAAALVLAVASGLFPVRIPGTTHSFAAGEIFIFLLLLAVGWQAAALVAAGEVAVGAYRTSKRWTSRLVTPAVGALSMGAAGALLQAAQQQLALVGLDGAALLLAVMLVFAGVYFVVNATMVLGVPRLRRGMPFFALRALLSDMHWVGLAYAGSASVATLLFVTWRQQGAGVLLVMVPLLAMLLVTLHFYFRQQETGRELRQASAGAAAREAEMAQREAQTAARHLRELQASERRFQNAFTHAGIGMALLAFDGRILQANRALADVLGHSAAGLAGMLFQDLVQADDRPALERKLGLSAGADFQTFAHEVRCQHADGSAVWLALNCSFFIEPPNDAPDESQTETQGAELAPAGLGQPCLILQGQDISARRRAEDRLQHLAFHDPLTGLPNRRRFQECLASALARSKSEQGRPWAVMFMDFDRFKLVNDSMGHGSGDELLQQVARRVQERLRPSDTVARMGGDEFAILVTEIEHERDALVLAERLLESLRQPFMLGTVELVISASIGITFSSLGYESAEAVLRDADTAMYRAKSLGKARYAIFDGSLHAAVSERLRLEGELRQAIAKGHLRVVYQPVFALGQGSQALKLTGFEALVRWQHAEDGLLTPADFLSVAEDSGLMLQLSDFVLHCACHQLRQWQQSHPCDADLTMSVNLSAHDLANSALVARVSRVLVESGLRPGQLTLELTENILMSQIEGVLPTLQALRGLGVLLSVDDFGTGYSSLSHLAADNYLERSATTIVSG